MGFGKNDPSYAILEQKPHDALSSSLNFPDGGGSELVNCNSFGSSSPPLSSSPPPFLEFLDENVLFSSSPPPSSSPPLFMLNNNFLNPPSLNECDDKSNLKQGLYFGNLTNESGICPSSSSSSNFYSDESLLNHGVCLETITTKKRKVEGPNGECFSLISKEELIESKVFIDSSLQSNVDFGNQFCQLSTSCFSNMNPPSDFRDLYSLHIGQQPPCKIVYNRILKPFPAIMLKENNFFSNSSQLFVDVFLIKNNDINQVLPYLEGKGPKPISNNNYCVFDKLKITSTSKSNKCQFRLLFQLIQFDGLQYNPVPNVHIVSNPIEVFSHSNYLKDEKKK